MQTTQIPTRFLLLLWLQHPTDLSTMHSDRYPLETLSQPNQRYSTLSLRQIDWRIRDSFVTLNTLLVGLTTLTGCDAGIKEVLLITNTDLPTTIQEPKT